MRSGEPAGGEPDGGKSAELFARARAGGGPVRNTRRTVCGFPRLRYPILPALCRGVLSAGRESLPAFFCFLIFILLNTEGKQYEV